MAGTPTIIRSRNACFLAKAQPTPLTDALPVPATDAVLGENIAISYNPNIIQTNEYTGSLDSADDIVGGMTAQVTIDVWLKGSGTAGTPPEWGKLHKACMHSEVITNAAIGAPTAVTAGTTTSVTLGAPFSNTAQIYRGMPLQISGTPANLNTFISDYTGGVATLTDTQSVALTTSALATIPANVLYLPTSGAQAPLTIYVYIDGLLWIFTDCVGTVKYDFTSGGAVKMSYTFNGLFKSKTAAALPSSSSLVYQTTSKPIWIARAGGAFLLGGNLISGKQMTLDWGASANFPDDPNGQEGYGAPLVTARRVTGQLSVNETLIASRDLMSDFRSGTKRVIHARAGTVAGNRWAMTIPSAQFQNDTPGNSNNIQTAQNPFKATGIDGGCALCLW
ncbi:hypothetical protein [Nitrospirillum bahiense]|uniref:Uncharacterized protein n=1 Tax=Nitrospirillum amazonense TaxID=28077 RepID=A0A560F1X5_9PROT|nr:hypothetical protein [Nitrospirillum amazonense]TWB15597.1 hypothetical protein FBZ88_12950 [Nitrospirillum amazonense]